MGQHFILSSDLSAIRKGKDMSQTNISEVPVKLVVWYDSLSCGSCEVSRMYAWNEITAYADSLSQWFNILFIFTPKRGDLQRINETLLYNTFDYPVILDRNSTFVKLNPKLPKNRKLHTFLLDKENRVVLVGSPLYNPTLWELYKRTIQMMIDNDGVLPE
jgi:hypothetical protein